MKAWYRNSGVGEAGPARALSWDVPVAGGDAAAIDRLAARRTVAVIGNQPDTLVLFRGPLIRAMAARGIEVHALVPDLCADDRKTIGDLGARPVEIPLKRANLRPWNEVAALVGLARVLKEIRPDVILSYFAKPAIYGSLAARSLGTPHFCMIEGAGYVFSEVETLRSFRRRMLRRLVRGLYRVAMARAEGVFLLNGDDHRLFVEERMARTDQVVRIPGIGVDLEHYAPAPTVSEPVTFLLMGRLLIEKGVPEFVAAARALKARHRGARFVLLGGIDANPGGLSEATVRAWTDEGLIEWPGRVADVRPWLERTSVLVLPSYYREGLPRSIMEAMAMGRAIVTTDVAGCRETVIDGVNGFRVPARDPGALAGAMQRFIEAPDLIREMGRASRRLAEERYDVDKVNRLILDAMRL